MQYAGNAVVGPGTEIYKYIYVTFRSEIIPQDRPEKSKFGNIPALAKIRNLFFLY